MSAIDHVPSARGHRSGRSRGPAGFMAHHLGRFRARRAQREYEASVIAFASGLRSEFREACTGLGLCQYVSVASGLTVRTPRVGEVRVGPPLSFTVELLPGQEGHDFTRKENAPRLAHSLGGHGLRVEPVAGRWVRLVILDGDPLATGLNLPPLLLDTVHALAILGRDEVGTTLGLELATAVHIAIEGMTRSGKSAFLQMLAAQLASAADLIVAGVDHTDLLLGRAWAGTIHRPWQSTGSEPDDIAAHADHLDALVRDMRARGTRLGRYQDKVTIGPDCPIVAVVLEEFPQLLDLADGLSTNQKPLGKRMRMAVKQLVAEGAKYGYRVIMIAQRFEGSAIGGVYVRDQFGLAISFSVPADSLRFLHGDQIDPATAAAHALAEPGIALVSGRGRPPTRFRAPYLPGGYEAFVRRIETTARRAAA